MQLSRVIVFGFLTCTAAMASAPPVPRAIVSYYPHSRVYADQDELKFGFPPPQSESSSPAPAYDLLFTKEVLSVEDIPLDDPRQPAGSHRYVQEMHERWTLKFADDTFAPLPLGKVMHRTSTWKDDVPPFLPLKNDYWFPELACRHFMYLNYGAHVLCKQENERSARLETFIPDQQIRLTTAVPDFASMPPQIYDYRDGRIGFFYYSLIGTYVDFNGVVREFYKKNYFVTGGDGTGRTLFSTLDSWCGGDRCERYDRETGELYFTAFRADALDDAQTGLPNTRQRRGYQWHRINLVTGERIFQSDVVDEVKGHFFETELDNQLYSWGRAYPTDDAGYSETTLAKLDRQTGKLLWTVNFGDSDPYIAYRTRYSLDQDPSFYVSPAGWASTDYERYTKFARVSAKTGEKLWEQTYTFKCSPRFEFTGENKDKIFVKIKLELDPEIERCTEPPLVGTIDKATGALETRPAR